MGLLRFRVQGLRISGCRVYGVGAEPNRYFAVKGQELGMKQCGLKLSPNFPQKGRVEVPFVRIWALSKYKGCLGKI